ncbi:MAG: sulfotransferase, partial [candidate division WOR-3 bacterium]
GGAPRCGTSWLYQLLDRHPDVHMAKPARPEPKFFLVDELYAKGIEYYGRTWFAEVGTAKVVGEKSANYLESRTAAERIREHLPQVKLVFLLRDPVQRAFSNYLWSRMNGWETEDFATALAREEKREKDLNGPLRFIRPYSYFSRGLYADHLASFFDRFPRRQILCLRYEDIVERPTVVAATVHKFLGIQERPQDGANLGVINPSVRGKEGLSPEVRRSLARRYAEPNRRLGALLGPGFRIWSYE